MGEQLKPIISSLILAALITSGCQAGSSAVANSSRDQTASEWNQAALDTISEEAPGPPVSARFLAIVHTAMFDAWTAYDNIAQPVYGDRVRAESPSESAKREAVARAAYEAILDLYPSQASRAGSLMAAQGLDPDSTSEAAEIGLAAAEAVLEGFLDDGSNQEGGYADTTGYTPVNTVDSLVDPGRWQPQTFVFDDGSTRTPGFLNPHWGQVRPFAVENVASLRPSAPAPYGSDEYRQQAAELLEITAQIGDREKVIAEYWADGPDSVLPPGHWCVFAQWTAGQRGQSLDDDVKMFFALANALHDSAITTWECKRFYDYVRPISAIRRLYAGQQITGFKGPGEGFGLVEGEDWIPYQPSSFITPPFAEHVSGHSTFSAAGAEILKRFTGSDGFGHSVTIAAGGTELEPGITPTQAVTLSWDTFSEAADEAGSSRLYGGIHFRNGDLNGRALGREVAGIVWDKAQRYIQGNL